MKTLHTIQYYMRHVPLIDYIVVGFALALAASFFILEGSTIAAILSKLVVASIIIGLWGLMAYTFMQTPFKVGKVIVAAGITFIAQTNLILVLTMDMKDFAINLWMVSVLIFVSFLIAGLMAEIKNNGKPRAT